MELRNDPRNYSFGTATFDSSPSVNFYAQLMAKRQAEKQAKDEAVNQYFHNVLKDLNPAGIRQVHLGGVAGQPPGIIDKINAWKEKTIANKNEIAKGGVARMENEMEANAILQDIQKAKNRDKFLLELGKAKFEGNYDPDEDDFHVIDRVSGSIYDPKTYKQDGVSEYGWNDLPSKAAAFDADKQTKFWGSIDKGIDAGKIYDYKKAYTNPQTGQVIVPFKEVFTPEQIQAKADRAYDLAKNDPSARKHFRSLLNSGDGEMYDKYNKAFKSVYGQNKAIETPEDFAAAEAILRYSTPSKEGQEQELNYSQRQQDKRINIFLNNSKSDNVTPIDLREQPDAGDGYKSITSMMGGIKTSVLPDGKSFIAEQVLYNPQTNKVKYIEYVNKDDVGKYGKPEWKEVSLTKFKQDVSTNNPGTDLKFLDRLKGAITDSPTGKKYKVNGYEYSEQEIMDAAKQLGMTKEAYMKKYGIK